MVSIRYREPVKTQSCPKWKSMSLLLSSPSQKNIGWLGRRHVDMNSLQGDIITIVWDGPIIGHLVISPMCTDHKC